MTPQQWAKTIAIVESGDRSNPPMGDGGQAIGRYQCHPAFVFEWAKRLSIYPTVNETWDAYFTRLVQAYFILRMGQELTPLEAAMAFHRGHIIKEDNPDWTADDYAARFTDAAAAVLTG